MVQAKSFEIAVAGIGNVARNNYLPFLKSQPDVELGYRRRRRSGDPLRSDGLSAEAFRIMTEGKSGKIILTYH